MHRRKQAAAVGFLLFLALWIIGMIRGLSLPYPEPPPLYLSSQSLLNEDYSARAQQNVANNLKQLGLALMPLPAVLDQANIDRIQVYERTARLTSGTTAFDDDGGRVRAALAAHQAVTFNEASSGLAPQRRLALEVGVAPERFDDLVAHVRQIGHLDTVNVQQQDRTAEFRRLHTQRQALKKHQETIMKLRGVAQPSLEDTLKLEQKIQDIEKELQTLGNQLGDLLGKESYYHVYLSLSEYQPGSRLDHTYSVPARVAHAFVWAAAWWLVCVAALGLLALTYLSVRTLWPLRGN